MKNIHLIPTDKPSRLSILNNGKLNLGAEIITSSNSKPQHLYITNDEIIKEGDWWYDNDGELCKYISYHVTNPNQWEDNKKIILTTDQKLIADGVQAIPDAFMKWYIKNPSCEEVKVANEIKWKSTTYDQPDIEDGFIYKIIFPQEEPTREILKEDKIKLKELYFKNNPHRKDIVEKRVNDFIANLKEASERLVPEASCELSNSEALYWQQASLILKSKLEYALMKRALKRHTQETTKIHVYIKRMKAKLMNGLSNFKKTK